MATQSKEIFVNLIGLKDNEANAPERSRNSTSGGTATGQDSEVTSSFMIVGMDHEKNQGEGFVTDVLETDQPSPCKRTKLGRIDSSSSPHTDSDLSRSDMAARGADASTNLHKARVMKKISKSQQKTAVRRNFSQRGKRKRQTPLSIRTTSQQTICKQGEMDTSDNDSFSDFRKKKNVRKIQKGNDKRCSLSSSDSTCREEATNLEKEDDPKYPELSSSATMPSGQSLRHSTRKRKPRVLFSPDGSDSDSDDLLMTADSDNLIMEADDGDVTYDVKPVVTARGRDRLFDSLGFSYIFRRHSKTENRTVWRCSVYSKNNNTQNCPAFILQVGDRFHRSKETHSHEKRAVKNHAQNKEEQDDAAFSVTSSARWSSRTSARRKKKMTEDDEDTDDGVDESITYTVLPCATMRKKDKLVDSLGYYYVSRGQKRNDNKIVWRCPAYGGRVKYCPAQVVQDGDRFTRSRRGHIHEKLNLRLGPSRRELERQKKACNPEAKRKGHSEKMWKKSRLSASSVSSGSASIQNQNGGSSMLGGDVSNTDDAGNEEKCNTVMDDEPIVDDSIKYEVIPSCSTRGRDKLFDSRGFSYVIRHCTKTANRILWRCPVHNGRVKYCPANVIQVGAKFYRSKKDHNHENNFGPIMTVASPDSEIYKIAQEHQRLKQLEASLSLTGEQRAQDVKTVHKRPTPPVAVPVVQKTEVLDDENDDNEEATPGYRILNACSMRGHDKLFDNEGYSYVIKHTRQDGGVHWRCAIRNKTYKYCAASIMQEGKKFMPFCGPHIHPPKDGEEVAKVVTQRLRREVEKTPNKAASVLVPEVLEEFLQGVPCPNLPSLQRLTRIVNYHRAKVKGMTQSEASLDPKLRGYRIIGAQVTSIGKDAAEALARELKEEVVVEQVQEGEVVF